MCASGIYIKLKDSVFFSSSSSFLYKFARAFPSTLQFDGIKLAINANEVNFQDI